MTVTRESINGFQGATNDTELDIEVGKIAEKQKAETGQSDPAEAIKARLLGEGFNRKVVSPESTEEDMRSSHEDTETAMKQDRENRVQAARDEADRIEAENATPAADADTKKSSKK